MSSGKKVLSPVETARLLMISPVTLRQWAQKKKIASHSTLGGHRRFFYDDVIAFAKRENITLLPQESSDDNGKKILIVDDEKHLCEFLKTLLLKKDENYVIEVAHNGFDAGVKAHQFKPSIILLDLKLPGLNGDEVCANIKSNPELSSIRVIGMTGLATPQNIENFIKSGAEQILDKPINETKLFDLINV